MTLESIILDIENEVQTFLGERKDITYKVNQVKDSLFVPATDPVPLNLSLIHI